MGLHTYIGARYVPKFAGVYDPTQMYEALSVVDNGSGTSYISRKDVPPGTPLTNTDYWFIYGASSGAIINLENRMNAAEADILDCKTGLRNALYLGNSYAQGVGSTSGTDGIFALSKQIFHNAYLKASGGAGFLAYTGHTATFSTLFDQAIADPDIDLSEITDVVILGAWGETCAYLEAATPNDFMTNLVAAIVALRNKIKTNCPNIRHIKYAWVETRSQHDILTAAGTSTYFDPFYIHNLMSILAPRNGLEYIGWVSWDTYMFPQFTSSDDYHPNDAGYLAISTAFMTAYDGHMEYYANEYYKNNFACGLTTNATIGATYAIYPDRSVIRLSELKIPNGDTTPVIYSDATIIDFGNERFMPVCFKASSAQLGVSAFWATGNGNNVPWADDQYLRMFCDTTGGKFVLKAQCYNAATACADGLNKVIRSPEIVIPHAVV